jgi:hypothetical protein
MTEPRQQAGQIRGSHSGSSGSGASPLRERPRSWDNYNHRGAKAPDRRPRQGLHGRNLRSLYQIRLEEKDFRLPDCPSVDWPVNGHLLANLCLLFFSRLLAELFKEGADAGEAAR